jgi:hypothetical protein
MKQAYLLILAIALPAHADDPFACVDPDIADAFLGDPYRGRGEYSTAIPDGFVELDLPPGLTLVGSQTAESITTVVFKTNMGRDQALNAAAGAMARSGWAENEQQSGRVTGGFQINSHPVTSTVLCNDDFAGALSVIAAEKLGRTFVSYVQHAASQSCGSRQHELVLRNPSEMMRLVPILKLPDDAKASNSGMGGNGHEVSSRVDVSGAISRTDLASFLENQIRDQRWEFQTGWSSLHSSGSVWVLDTNDDGLLIGTLHLFDSGEDPIRVRFSVTPADPTKGRQSGSWSGSST